MVKRYWRILLLLLLICGINSTAAASGVKVIVDGEAVEFARPPVLDGGRLLVPMRDIFTAMGAVVKWDEASNAALAVFDDVRVNMPIGSFLPTVNAMPVPIAVPAAIRGGHIFIPMRFAVESLGARLFWDASADSAVITTIGAADGPAGNDQDPPENDQGKIDINTASLENLLELDGLSETAARDLLAFREANGGFKTFAEIRDLPSMTDTLFERLRENIRIVYRKEGIACWYGIKFHGRRTASGEIYNKNLHTAAHRTLPFGTKVKVTFPRTGRSVWVRINDRGPHVAGRIIDLSHSAADAIGLTPYGIGRVELKVVKAWERKE